MTVHCFGDSWAYGSELDFTKEFPFVHHFAKLISSDYINYGIEGASLGIILQSIANNVNNFQIGDVVLAVIPPDVRWYGQNTKKGFYTLNIQHAEYKLFLQDKTSEWFLYHHALFVFAIQKLLQNSKVKYLLAFNYGSADCINHIFPIDQKTFIDKQDLFSLLQNKNKNQGRTWLGYQFNEDGPSDHYFSGKYFEGKLQHPNELGHKKIAEIFLNSYNKVYK